MNGLASDNKNVVNQRRNEAELYSSEGILNPTGHNGARGGAFG
jgi:hypothetical protein